MLTFFLKLSLSFSYLRVKKKDFCKWPSQLIIIFNTVRNVGKKYCKNLKSKFYLTHTVVSKYIEKKRRTGTHKLAASGLSGFFKSIL